MIASGDRRHSAASRAVKEDEVNQMDVTSVDSNSFVEEDHSKNNFIEEKGYHIGNLAEGLQNVKEHIGRVIALSITVLSAKANRTKLDPSDPRLDSQCNDGHRDGSSGSKSDGKEMSDSHAANGVSVINEPDPLLDSETSQADLASKDNADDGSVSFSQNHVSEDGSGEEEAETQDDDDDEEAQEEKDDGNKAAVTWTADDQRTLMELGNTELERNLRLEMLIAKRKASKAMEKNLIDLDGNMDEILQCHGHLPSVNASRRNPFDLPDVLDESVPGSAPSVLLPRQNPFDLPYEQVADEENLSHKGFVAVPQHDILLLRRHESFTVGASFFSDFNQEKHSSRFTPYFGAEEMDFADPQRKLREISDSNVKSTLKSGTVSLVTDQEHPRDLHRMTGSPITHSAGYAENDSRVANQMKMNDDHTNHLNHSIMMEQTHQATENIGAVECNTKEGSESKSPISYAVRSEVIEEECESSSTSSSEAEKNTSRISSTHEQISNQEQITSGSSKVSARSVAADSGIVNVKADHVHDDHVLEPVYDSSPTISEKSHSNSALDEAPYVAGKQDAHIYKPFVVQKSQMPFPACAMPNLMQTEV
ncbi:hypothetical protein BHM03_00053732 [Ensete ventricosum]|nr:hypothetical protein BHM03_00053732 [Ensete ventricosum]